MTRRPTSPAGHGSKQVAGKNLPLANPAVVQIQKAKERFTAGERRVADFCVQTFPRTVFETVSGVADATGTSPQP